MEQEEVDKIMSLAREAVFYEYRAIDSREVEKRWRELCNYVMLIAADRANRALKAHEEGIL